MRVLWLSWKDEGHPEAGGAEKVSGELRRHLVADGHEVILVTAQYAGSKENEEIDGIKIRRTGNRYSVYFHAWQYCRTELKDWPDLVIDEMNTIPFGASLYYRNTPVYLLAYQLAREVWFYQMIFPLSLIGYLLEPLMLLFLARTNYRGVLTESESSQRDLQKYGFRPISIFPIWLDLAPLPALPPKTDLTKILSLGAVRPMKRTLDVVKAFEAARRKDNHLTLSIAGDVSAPYAQKVQKYIETSEFSKDIALLGRVSNQERLELMRESAIILVTSVKEGWGLIVTEANSQGTPAAVYDTDGLRDSVQTGVTGLITPASKPGLLGDAVAELLQSPERYNTLREKAWSSSMQFTVAKTYKTFCSIVMEKVA